MTTLSDLAPLGPFALHDALLAGHPFDAAALDGREYHGVALGNPAFVEALTWKTFKKVFLREPTGALRGWNVAVEQRGVDGPYVDKLKGGKRVTYGHYEVRPASEYASGRKYAAFQMIDYGHAEVGALNIQRLIRDPLAAVNPGSADLLLGYSYLDLGFCVPTPTFFALVRGEALTYVVPRPGT
jgi:hypothetical protein